MKKENENKFKNMRKRNGITLIALVITIIVLLILAGVSIATLTGENGILTRAQEAKTQTEEAEDIEKIRLAVSESQIGDNGYQKLNQNNLQEAIDNQFEGRDVAVFDNGDGTFNVTLDDKIYKIENDVVNEVQVDLYINNAEDLKKFRDEVNNGETYEGKYILQTNDINLDINEEWIPIGTYLNENVSITDETNIPFKGTFDGQNHTIDGIKITSQEKGKGLFGLVYNGTVKNVIIGKNCNIDAGVSLGSITGYLYNNGSVINCINEANLKASGNNFGGIVGTNLEGCNIESCINTGTLTGETSVGGIVGYNTGNIQKSYNLGAVSSGASAGGISAYNTGNIRYCFNKGSITSEGSNIGGISGGIQGEGIAKSCYNVGNITGNGSNVGGIVGHLYSESAKILDSYNIGNVIVLNNNQYGGGIIGVLTSGSIQNCYFLENTVNGGNGSNAIDGVEIKSSQSLKSLSQILGNEFKQDINNINDGYPILSWQ